MGFERACTAGARLGAESRRDTHLLRNHLGRAQTTLVLKDAAHDLVERVEAAKARLDDREQALPIVIEEATRVGRVERLKLLEDLPVVLVELPVTRSNSLHLSSGSNRAAQRQGGLLLDNSRLSTGTILTSIESFAPPILR